MIQKIDKKAVQDAVQMAYDRCKNETGGKNAVKRTSPACSCRRGIFILTCP